VKFGTVAARAALGKIRANKKGLREAAKFVEPARVSRSFITFKV
jgi:hypothetical protein